MTLISTIQEVIMSSSVLVVENDDNAPDPIDYLCGDSEVGIIIISCLLSLNLLLITGCT